MFKMSKRFLATALSAAMLVSCLAGCSSSGSSADTGSSATESGYSTSEYTTSGLMYTGDVCEEIFGYPADTVVATMNGEDLTLLDISYWLTYDCNILAYYSYGTLDAITWDDAYSDDYTMAEFIKEDVLYVAVNYKLIEVMAAEAGIELTDEQVASVEEIIQSYVESFGADLWDTAVEAGTISEDDFDDDAYAAWVQAAGEDEILNQVAIYVTTVDFLRYMNEIYYYYENLQEYYFGEGGEYAPTEEDIAQYVEDEGYVCSQSILFMNLTDEDGETVAFSDMDDDQKAELLAKAQAALDDILSSDDPVATFESYQEESDDTGSNSAGASYTFQEDDMVDEYYEGVLALEVGEIGAELVESSSYGYFIVMRCPVEADAVPVYYATYGYDYSIEYLYINSAYTSLVDSWNTNADVVTNSIYDELDLTDFCTNLLALEDILYPTETTEE